MTTRKRPVKLTNAQRDLLACLRDRWKLHRWESLDETRYYLNYGLTGRSERVRARTVEPLIEMGLIEASGESRSGITTYFKLAQQESVQVAAH